VGKKNLNFDIYNYLNLYCFELVMVKSEDLSTWIKDSHK